MKEFNWPYIRKIVTEMMEQKIEFSSVKPITIGQDNLLEIDFSQDGNNESRFKGYRLALFNHLNRLGYNVFYPDNSLNDNRLFVYVGVMGEELL